jgi:hypothetical protein
MIQKILYNILSNDITDDNQANVLTTIQAIHPGVTSLNGIEYYYKSLKTLLGDTTINWNKNKIFYEQYERMSDNWALEEEKLPAVGIGLYGSITDISNQAKTFQCDLKIEVKGKARDNQSTARNIALRIRKYLESVSTLDELKHYCHIYNDYSITHFSLTFQRFDKFINNQVSIIYRCRFSLI